MCYHLRRCALTLSPHGPHHFTHHPGFEIQIFQSEILFEIPFETSKPVGWFALCCTCRRPKLIERPAVSGLAAL